MGLESALAFMYSPPLPCEGKSVVSWILRTQGGDTTRVEDSRTRDARPRPGDQSQYEPVRSQANRPFPVNQTVNHCFHDWSQIWVSLMRGKEFLSLATL